MITVRNNQENNTIQLHTKKDKTTTIEIRPYKDLKALDKVNVLILYNIQGIAPKLINQIVQLHKDKHKDKTLTIIPVF
jgi:hypothetical protein